MMDYIVAAVLAAINSLFSLIPNYTLPYMDSANNSVVAYIFAGNTIIPVQTILQVIAASMALRAILGAWDGVVWIYHQFWGGD